MGLFNFFKSNTARVVGSSQKHLTPKEEELLSEVDLIFDNSSEIWLKNFKYCVRSVESISDLIKVTVVIKVKRKINLLNEIIFIKFLYKFLNSIFIPRLTLKINYSTEYSNDQMEL